MFVLILRTLTVLMLIVPAACEKPLLSVADEGFLAVVVNVEGPVEISPGQDYRIRIYELSGTLGINDTLRALPNDTIIRTYPLATYDVWVDGVPLACTSRYGLGQRARISSPGNTSVARFNIHCSSLLTLHVYTDGWNLDDTYVWRVRAPDGSEQSGLAGTMDTVRVDDISAGAHIIELGHVAPNCIVTNDGGRVVDVSIAPPVAQTVGFRVRCSNPEQAPQLLHFESDYRNGAVGFYAEVSDPDLDLEAYTWTLTDCSGRKLFPDVGLIRRGLTSGRTAGAAVAKIVGSVGVDKDIELVDRQCSQIHFTDLQGNTTVIAERRVGTRSGSPPFPVNVNAVLAGGTRITTTIEATDADDDLAGAFISVMLRDGLLSRADGRPDIGIYNVAGYLPPFSIPDLVVDGRVFRLNDVLGIIVDLVDRNGNVTRVVDTDLLH